MNTGDTLIESPSQIEAAALLDVVAVAKLCGISTRTLRRLKADSAFPQPIRIGNRLVRWRASDVRDWIASRVPIGNVA